MAEEAPLLGSARRRARSGLREANAPYAAAQTAIEAASRAETPIDGNAAAPALTSESGPNPRAGHVRRASKNQEELWTLHQRHLERKKKMDFHKKPHPRQLLSQLKYPKPPLAAERMGQSFKNTKKPLKKLLP